MDDCENRDSESNILLVVFAGHAKRTSSNSKNICLIEICAVAGITNLLHAGTSAQSGLG
jgi:hypothetical protein